MSRVSVLVLAAASFGCACKNAALRPPQVTPPAELTPVAAIADGLRRCAASTLPFGATLRSEDKDDAEFVIDSSGDVTRNLRARRNDDEHHQGKVDDRWTVSFVEELSEETDRRIGNIYVIALGFSTGELGRTPRVYGEYCLTPRRGGEPKHRRLLLPHDALENDDDDDVWALIPFMTNDAGEAIGLALPTDRPLARESDDEFVARETVYVHQRFVEKLKPSAEQILGNKDVVNNAHDVWALTHQLEHALTNTDLYPKARPALIALMQDPKIATLRDEARTLALDRSATPSIAAFKVAWEALAKDEAMPSSVLRDHCASAINPDWRMFGVFELPNSEPGHTIQLALHPLAETSQQQTEIHGLTIMTTWATHVPRDQRGQLGLYWNMGADTGRDFAAVLGSALGMLSGGGVNANATPAAGGIPDGTPRAKVSTLLEYSSARECRRLLPALATYSSVARTTALIADGQLIRNHVYTVSACMGDCDGGMAKPVKTGADDKTTKAGADDKTTKAGADEKSPAKGTEPAPAPPPPAKEVKASQAKFTSPAGILFTMLGAIEYDLDALPDAGAPLFGDYQWQATTPASATQQIYKLTLVHQPQYSFALSLFFGVLFSEHRFGRFGLAFGPALINGSGGGALQQWTFNVLYGPPWWNTIAKNVYFYTGFGFRFFNEPVNDKPGDLLALTRMNGMTLTQPSVTTHVSVAPIFSFGISIDLTVIGQVASNIFSKIGGSK